jgi:hypothetical protein
MKKNLSIFILISINALAFCSNVFAQPSIAGGWSTTNPSETESVAKFALSQQPGGLSWTLVKINQAERQVVAGINTKLYLTIQNSGQISCAKAVVFTDLQQQNHLSTWEWTECPTSSPIQN